jgi:hypothetical protein
VKSLKSWDQRQRIWRHNSFLGHAALMKRNAQNIFEADSTSRDARLIAKEIYRLASELKLALKERIDP